MRLNETEARLINYLRNIDVKALVNELRNSTTLMLPGKHVKDLVSILGKETITLQTLLSSEFMTNEQLDYLIECIRKNKNIIITGESNTGKTTLLNTLIDFIYDRNILIYDRLGEIIVDEDFCTRNRVIFRNEESLSMADIAHYNDNGNKLLIISETDRISDLIAMAVAINSGYSVIGTSYLKGENWKEGLINDRVNYRILNSLVEYKFIQVNLVRNEGGKRYINKIEEI